MCRLLLCLLTILNNTSHRVRHLCPTRHAGPPAGPYVWKGNHSNDDRRSGRLALPGTSAELPSQTRLHSEIARATAKRPPFLKPGIHFPSPLSFSCFLHRKEMKTARKHDKKKERVFFFKKSNNLSLFVNKTSAKISPWEGVIFDQDSGRASRASPCRVFAGRATRASPCRVPLAAETKNKKIAIISLYF